MQSTFSGIEIGKRSLIAHNAGLTTVGHNLSNASVEGYSRQRVEMKATDPLYDPALNRETTPGQIGQGMGVERIERIRDQILEGRIVSQAQGEQYWGTRDKYLLALEQMYNEPTDLSVRTLMDKYWESWQELSIHPAELGARKAVLQRGQALMDGIHHRYDSLRQLRNMLEDDVAVTVEQVNKIAKDIAALNQEIVKVKAVGDNPNDLLDRRDLLVEKLAGLVNITVDTRDPDEFTIHTAGLHLVQGRIYRSFRLEVDQTNDGYSKVVWNDVGDTARFEGGKLASLLTLRDMDVRSEIQKLDAMTINFSDMVNEIHRAGYGTNGQTGLDFFIEYPFINNLAGNYDRNGDGQYDSSYIFRITGVNALQAEEQVGLKGTITLEGARGRVTVEYFPTDTVGDLITKINHSGAEVVARLDRSGRLEIKATPSESTDHPDFVIRHLEDSGQFLVGYAGLLQRAGQSGAYTWQQADAVLSLRGGDLKYAVAPLSHPAGWLEINPELKRDAASIAAGFGENGRPAMPGDGSAAVAVAALRNQTGIVGKNGTFDDYFADTVAEIGLKGEEAARALETHTLIMKELRDMRESISGVNIDEELSQMIKFQHGYAAAARFISVVDNMIDTIINRMGV